MIGGGAERVAAQIINMMNSKGFDTRFLLTSSKKNEVLRSDLNEKTELILLTEEMKAETALQKLRYLPTRFVSSFFGKVYEKADKYVPALIGKMTIVWQYHREISYIRQLMLDDPDMAVIAFLQPAIPITVLAGKGLPNKIILSERGDPKRFMKKRYGRKFIEKYYDRADKIVFQTEDARTAYPENISKNGTVISNPVKSGLPQPYKGERKKNITTFCRISPEKNLTTLVDAFLRIKKEHPEYKLRIIGNAVNIAEKEALLLLKEHIAHLKLEESVFLEPFMQDVHKSVLQDAMYINSSDHEGLSNAMLEAMAIGMPVVCTDCPIGGARATINDGENGLLVPVNNSEELYKAIKRVIEEDGLADKLSYNAAKLRDELSLEAITEKWIRLL